MVTGEGRNRFFSGIAAAKARGKKLGRQPGQRPKSDRLGRLAHDLIALIDGLGVGSGYV